jgi:hypothetical protein
MIVDTDKLKEAIHDIYELRCNAITRCSTIYDMDKVQEDFRRATEVYKGFIHQIEEVERVYKMYVVDREQKSTISNFL